MRTNKNTSKIILAVAVAFLATFISYTVFSNMQNELTEKQNLIELMQKTEATTKNETYAYAVSKSDLIAGEIVSDEDVDFKQFDSMNTNAFENRSDVVNKVLLKNISNGEVFTTEYIAKISKDDISLKDGCRALTLPAESFQGKSDSMKSGDYIDIYSALSDNDWALEHIRIMSFESDKKISSDNASNSSNSGNSSTPDTGITNANSITFEVPVDSISDLISNVSKGKLVLVARSANDKKIYHKKTKLPHYSSSFNNSNFNGESFSSLPKLPKSVPIKNLSGLPQPIQPIVPQSSVEVIEANVKSKVTFD